MAQRVRDRGWEGMGYCSGWYAMRVDPVVSIGVSGWVAVGVHGLRDIAKGVVAVVRSSVCRSGNELLDCRHVTACCPTNSMIRVVVVVGAGKVSQHGNAVLAEVGAVFVVCIKSAGNWRAAGIGASVDVDAGWLHVGWVVSSDSGTDHR